MNTSFEPQAQTPTQRTDHQESHSAIAYPSRTIVHAKLEMTEPGDHDEQEADAAANTIVSGGKIARKIAGGSGSSGIAVSQQMESQLSQLQGGGRQMPEGLRNMMENGFGQDFSQVRLHTDNEAASMSSSIHAKAFTLGNDIYFNRGQFSPESSEGQRLVAHELTHVVQGTGKVGRYDMDDSRWEGHNQAGLDIVHTIMDFINNDDCSSHYTSNSFLFFPETKAVRYNGNNNQCSYFQTDLPLLKSMIENSITALESLSIRTDPYLINVFNYCFVNPDMCNASSNPTSSPLDFDLVRVVLENFKTMKRYLDSEKIIDGEDLQCGPPTDPGKVIRGCTSHASKNNGYIFIDSSAIRKLYPNDPLSIYITIIHELSHDKADTGDRLYFSNRIISNGAIPLEKNADSYSSFAGFVSNRADFEKYTSFCGMTQTNPNGTKKINNNLLCK